MQTRIVYYARLVGLQYIYWIGAGLWNGMSRPFAKSVTIAGRRVKFQFHRAFTAIAIFPIGLLIFNNAAHAFLAYGLFALLWSLNQNVAHYGLDAESRQIKRVAARSYAIHPVLDRLSYGSFRHFEHHAFPRMGYFDLIQPETKRAAEKKFSVIIKEHNGRDLLMDFFIRQFSGPVENQFQKWPI